MGIRNGGGLSMQPMPAAMAGMGMVGLKNSPSMGMMNNVGLRPSGHNVHPSPLASSCNPVMSVQQRRTLLLQVMFISLLIFNSVLLCIRLFVEHVAHGVN